MLAFPTPEGDTGTFLTPSNVSSSDEALPWADLLAGKDGTSVEIPAAKKHLWLEIEFAEPTTVRSIELPPIELLMARRCFIPDSRIRIQAMLDSEWQDLITHEVPYANWQDRQPEHPFVLAMPDVQAQKYRLVFENHHRMVLTYLRLSSTARLQDWTAQAGFALRNLTRTPAPQQALASFIDPATIIDLSEHCDAEGKLTWTAPAGQWTVLRFGHVNTGTKNKPAPPEATGFECDKLSPAGAEQHFAGYIGRISAQGGPADEGRLQGMLIDSWECYTQTWTPAMEAEFASRRGYSLRQWLPALAGYVLEDPATSERFLRDWRLTISDMLVEHYFGRLAELARERGMKLSFETAIGDVSPGDILRYHGKADIPMCEIWKPNDPHFGGYETKPVHPTVSAAHIYGKTHIAAEAFTDISHDWSDHLFSYKHIADRNFALGINHLVFHTYTHNPRDQKPGTSFGGRIGSPFIRGQTWWQYMPLFTDYLARCQHLLQQGNPVADVLWYLGDDLNHRPLQNAPFPNGFAFDYLNQDVLLNRLTVVDGKLRNPEGTEWSAIWLPAAQCRRLTPTTLARLQDLIHAGASVIGQAPLENPTLAGGNAATADFASLVKSLWGGQPKGDRQLGKGRLLWGEDLEASLAKLEITPDVRGLRPLAWHHRSEENREIYFITADREVPLDATLDFRATGKVQFWDPLANTIAPAPILARTKGRTQISIQLPASGSLFVIFSSEAAESTFTSVDFNGERLLDAKNTNNTDLAKPYPHLGLNASTPVQPWVTPREPHFEFIANGTRFLAYQDGTYRLQKTGGSVQEITSTNTQTLTLTEPWTLTFPQEWVSDHEQALAKLAPWTSLTDPEARCFSGTASYRTEIALAALAPHQRAILDLGRVDHIAEILLNGQPVTTLWAPPFRTDITEFLKEGRNHLEVRVTNAWHNRLSYDQSLPPEKRKSWTLAGPQKDRPLKTSGITGPAILRIASESLLAE